MAVRILIGDVRARLRDLPSAYFDCVTSSPPYWGLREYGVDGQLGLERTLGEHLDVLVDVFREVRRVLKHQGIVFLNYGDCYAAAPNGKSAAEYKADGSDDRTFRDKPFSTVGAIYEQGHSAGRGPRGERADEMRHRAVGAMYDPTGGRSGGGVRGENKGNTGGTNKGRVVGFFDPGYATARGKFSTGERDTLRHDTGGRVVAGGLLKPKDLCMIANRLAIALQDDGWYVRSEIIWHKPNPMPESIYDRPTTAHEKVWMLSKSEDYFYNHEAIREPVTGGAHSRVRGKETHGRHTLGDALPEGERRQAKTTGPNSRQNVDRTPLSRKKIKVPGGWDVAPGAHGAVHRRGRTSATYADLPGVTPKSAAEASNVRAKGSFHASTTGMVEDRNARNVWTIASAPFDGEFCLACRSYFAGKEKRLLRIEKVQVDGREQKRRYCPCGAHDRWLSHFATFPRALAERCIKAGVPLSTCHLCGEARSIEDCGGMCAGQERDPGRVLDPFGGAGTVGLVANALGLDATLIELNPDYAEMAARRISSAGGAVSLEPPTPLLQAAE